MYGIQTGLLGAWVYNETRLTNSTALITEIGFDFGVWKSTFYNDFNDFFLLTSVIIVEPRFYYNLNKRSKKSKRIDGNSSSFVALNMSYHPDWFVISKKDDFRIVSDISIIPTWGIRRHMGKTL